MKKPHTVPMHSVIRNASSVDCMWPYFSSMPMAMPDSASVEVIEMSMPPTSMTPSMPRAMTMVTALFFIMSVTDSKEKNAGLMMETTTNMPTTMAKSRNSREPTSFFSADFCIMPRLLSWWSPSPWPDRGSSPGWPHRGPVCR